MSKKKTKISQKDQTIIHLAKHGSITQFEALAKYGIMRLASRIDELKNEGYKISTEMLKAQSGHRYARYHLRK